MVVQLTKFYYHFFFRHGNHISFRLKFLFILDLTQKLGLFKQYIFYLIHLGMAYSPFMEVLDRLTTKTVMRGSTASYLGVIGTLLIFIICFIIYIPATKRILAGDYFETQFYNYKIQEKEFFINSDLKVAIVFRNRINNTVANHSQIQNFAYQFATQLHGDYSDYFRQELLPCEPNYFKDAVNSFPLQDCFIFPHNIKFSMLFSYGGYSYLSMFFFPKTDINPFLGTDGFSGYQSQFLKFMEKYYYQVLFTSKMIDSEGNEYLQLHRFYSTQVQVSSEIATSTNVINYIIKNTTLDISIMPWINKQKHENLVWHGEQWNLYQDNQQDSIRYGVQVYLYKSQFNSHAFRYYKKVDMLLGAIGGAMLLIYILLWIPFNYINKTLHQIRNAECLLLQYKGKYDEPYQQHNIQPIQFSFRVWLSNPILNYFFKSLKRQNAIVDQAEKQLDVVNFIKQMKVVDRTLKKKLLQQNQSDKKILILKQEGALLNQEQQLKNIKESQPQQSMSNVQQMDQDDDDNEQQQGEILAQSYKQQQFDIKYGLTNQQLEYIKTEPANEIFLTHMTLLTLNGDSDRVEQLKQISSKERWRGNHEGARPKKFSKKMFSILCDIIEKCDCFGARPSLIAKPFDSSFVGCIATCLIIFFTMLIAGVTLANSKTPQYQLLQEMLPEEDFGFTLKSGVNLKYVFCTSSYSRLVGSSRQANLQFFVDKNNQRTYYQAQKLTSGDLDDYDIVSPGQFSWNLDYCFRMPPNIQVQFERRGDYQSYMGIRIQPFCSSTQQYCNNNRIASQANFLKYINETYNYLFFPQNRYDQEKDQLINNLIVQQLNINYRYMNNLTSFQQTVYLDQIRLLDDTKNYFMRKQPIIKFQSIRINPNTPYSISTSVNRKSTLYYEVKIKGSSLLASVIIQTPKSDVILGIVGGIFVIMYAIFHWIGKIYNGFNFRARLAEVIYDEQSIYQSFLLKYLAISPLPIYLFPKCFDLKYTISRMRQVDKKIINDLDYLWLVKYMKNCFNLSSAVFNRIEQRHLSLVYVKEKVDQGQLVVPPKEEQHHEYNEQQFLDRDEDEIEQKMNKKHNKINNQIPQMSKQKINLQKITVQKDLNDFAANNKYINTQVREQLSQNYFHNHPKPIALSWFDTFQYKSSFTYQGKRQVTSCVGGCCCLILVMFIAIIISFELGVFLRLQDTKIGKNTFLMQPLANQSNGFYNSKINLQSGTNFKLAVTFSAYYTDYPHNISTYVNNGIGVDIFQITTKKVNGKIQNSVIKHSMVPCVSDYITSWISSLIDPQYYKFTQYGYCIPDGLDLSIQGLPQDQVKKSFTLSIYDRTNTPQGTQTLKKFLNNFNPKYHFSYPYPQIVQNKISYEITSFMFDHLNITQPTQQNITLSKRIITYEGEVKDKTKPDKLITYVAQAFQQGSATFTSTINTKMYYNLTFDNSYLVQLYTVKGPQKQQSFGLFGGVIAILIFGFGIFPRAYNNYRMKYLIGRQIYIFDMLVSKQKKNVLRGKIKKTKQQSSFLKQINNYNQWNILLAFLASFVSSIVQNYNFIKVLRHVTLIQQRVEKDLSLYEVYKNVHKYRDILNSQLTSKAKNQKIADIFGKQFFVEQPMPTSLQGMNNIKTHAKKNNWNAFEEHAVAEAIRTRVKINNIFDNAFLERAFNIEINSNASLYGSQLGGTVGFGTSVVESEMASQLRRQQYDIQ